jgi:hypothetical protein
MLPWKVQSHHTKRRNIPEETIFVATTVRKLKFSCRIFKNEEHEEYGEMSVVLRRRLEGTVRLFVKNRSLVSNMGRIFQP